MIQPCDLDFNYYLSVLLDDNDYDCYYNSVGPKLLYSF